MPMSKRQFRAWKARMEAIRQRRDWDALFALEDSGDFMYCLPDLLYGLAGPEGSPEPLNHPQRVLFLCMTLENCAQCDSLFNFFDEGLSVYGLETAAALEELGAPQSAALLREVLALLPPEGYPVDDYAACRALCGGPFGQAVEQADSRLADYPDGLLSGLYFAYAHAHREEFP